MLIVLWMTSRNRRNLPVISVSDSCSTSSIAKTRQSDGCMVEVDCASGRGATSNARKQEWQWAKRAAQRRFLHSPSQKCTLCTIYESTRSSCTAEHKQSRHLRICNVVGSEILRMKPPLKGMTDCRSEHLRNNALHDRGWGFSILTPFCPLGSRSYISGLWTDLRRGGRASNIVQPTSLH